MLITTHMQLDSRCFIQKPEDIEVNMNCVLPESAPKFRVSTFNRACDVLNLLNVRSETFPIYPYVYN